MRREKINYKKKEDEKQFVIERKDTGKKNKNCSFCP
jgi:hypothetical protein